MDHRIDNNEVLTFKQPASEVPDEIGISFELSDLPASWGMPEPLAVHMDGYDVHAKVRTSDGEHTLIFPMENQFMADSFRNFPEVLIIGINDEGLFGLEQALSWSDR